MWAPMYAILNFIIESEAIAGISSASMISSNLHALTFGTQSAIIDATSDVASMTGAIDDIDTFNCLCSFKCVCSCNG